MNDYRFPTVVGGAYGRTIPVLPHGDVFDTIPGAQEIESIMARPPWDFAEADARLQPAVQKALEAKGDEFEWFGDEPPKKSDRTKTTATPKRRPNRKVNP